LLSATTFIGDKPNGEQMMGADLYIESNYNSLQSQHGHDFQDAVHRRDKAKTLKGRNLAQADVERLFDTTHVATAYFRDAYNSSCLLAQLKLSWWNDVAPRLTEDDHLPLPEVAWLLEEVRGRRLSRQTVATEEQQAAADVIAKVSGKGVTSQVALKEKYSAEDVEWFVSRKVALITFLQTAIELGEESVCSL
jgi:hypothetical protein